MKVKKQWKNEPYVTKDEYDELIKGGKDVFLSAVIVLGSTVIAGAIMLLMYIFN